MTLHVQADGLHLMQLWAPWWEAAAASLDRAAAFALTVTAPRRRRWPDRRAEAVHHADRAAPPHDRQPDRK